MPRTTQLAKNDFDFADLQLNTNVPIASPNPTTRELADQITTMANAFGFAMAGLKRLSDALPDIYDVCARIEANQKKATGMPHSGAGVSTRFPSIP